MKCALSKHIAGAGDAAGPPVGSEQLGQDKLWPAAWNPAEKAWPTALAGPPVFFVAVLTFDACGGYGDRAILEHRWQGFLPAKNVWSLNPFPISISSV